MVTTIALILLIIIIVLILLGVRGGGPDETQGKAGDSVGVTRDGGGGMP